MSDFPKELNIACGACDAANVISSHETVDEDLPSSTTTLPIAAATTTEKDSTSEVGENGEDKARRDSQCYEALAFRSQFDEVTTALARLLESSNKSNSQYNIRSNGHVGRTANTGQQTSRIISESNFTHQRSFSSPALSSTRYNNVIKHQRSSSSPNGLSSNTNFYPTRPSFRGINGFDFYAEESEELLNYLDDPANTGVFREADNGSSRIGLRLEPDWEPLTPLSSAGLLPSPFRFGPFTSSPLTPSSLSYSSVNHYYGQPHSTLDDEELLQKQIQLEEDRKLLQIQQRQLDKEIAVHNLQLINDLSLSATEPVNGLPTPHQSRDSLSKFPKLKSKETLISTPQKKPPLKKLSIGPRLFNQEPIGTPNKKSAPPTPTSTCSNSSSTNGFSLFARSPTMSLNQIVTSSKNSLACESNYETFSPFDAFPLTPTGTPPPKEDDCFPGFLGKHNQQSAPIFPRSPLHPLYSPSVQEHDEEAFWDDEASFDSFDQNRSSSSAPVGDDWDYYRERMAAVNMLYRDQEVSNPEAMSRRPRFLSKSKSNSSMAPSIVRRSSESAIRSTCRMSGNDIPAGGDYFRVPEDNNRFYSTILEEGFGKENQEIHRQTIRDMNESHVLYNNLPHYKQKIPFSSSFDSFLPFNNDTGDLTGKRVGNSGGLFTKKQSPVHDFLPMMPIEEIPGIKGQSHQSAYGHYDHHCNANGFRLEVV